MVRLTTSRRPPRTGTRWGRPVFAALAAVPGCLMAATLTVGGIVAWRDPLMRPPKLPNRRPPAWGLPAAGVFYGAGTVSAASVVARGRRSFPSPAEVGSALALSALAAPGVMLPVFDVARRTWARRDRGAAGTVIVLGCALRDGRPSTLLRYRLEKAEEVARRTTEPATVICCGGVGEDGGPSEAEVMADWLRGRGLDDIRLEALSTSTLENLANAAPMVDRGPVTVVTSDFHVFRTGSLARRAGHAAWRIEGSPTPPQYWATSMLREFLALGTWWSAPGVAVGGTIFGTWLMGEPSAWTWASQTKSPPRG